MYWLWFCSGTVYAQYRLLYRSRNNLYDGSRVDRSDSSIDLHQRLLGNRALSDVCLGRMSIMQSQMKDATNGFLSRWLFLTPVRFKGRTCSPFSICSFVPIMTCNILFNLSSCIQSELPPVVCGIRPSARGSPIAFSVSVGARGRARPRALPPTTGIS